LGLPPDRPIVVFTQHSVTTEADQAGTQVAPSLVALKQLADEGVQVVVTYPNNDAGAEQILSAISEIRHQGIQVRP
jgi:hypothetical protein